MTAVDLALAAAVVAGALVQSATGIGFALIVAPICAAMRPALLPGLVLLLMIPLNAMVAWREREHFDRRGVGWISVGRVAGGVAALWLLAQLSARGLSLLIGLSTLAAVLASLLAPRFAPGRSAFMLAGAITGVTETTTGVGGPPLALVYQYEPPPVLRANLALCFLLGELLSLALLLPAGLLHAEQIDAAALLLAPLALGAISGLPLRRWISQRTLRGAVLAFATVSSLWVVWRAI